MFIPRVTFPDMRHDCAIVKINGRKQKDSRRKNHGERIGYPRVSSQPAGWPSVRRYFLRRLFAINSPLTSSATSKRLILTPLRWDTALRFARSVARNSIETTTDSRFAWNSYQKKDERLVSRKLINIEP